MRKFRYRKEMGMPYEKQGYIFFASQGYSEQPERKRRKIEDLCKAVAGEHWRALLCYVTTQAECAQVCQRFHVEESTLYRSLRRYYRNFDCGVF